MGAVQKLATVTMAGLVALATVLVIYIADEPNRRGGETNEQEHVALERGAELYITYCLQCHGPAGFGAADGDGRVGASLNQSALNDEDLGDKPRFQSDDPAQQDAAEAYIRYSITYGKPEQPYLTDKSMPAFGQELNVEEINDLVYLIMYGDWNYVYNQALLHTGETYAQAQCDATPTTDETAEWCEKVEHPDPLYPTVPPPAGGSTEEEATPAAAPVDGAIEIDAEDPAKWSITAVNAKPGDVITVKNVGFVPHDFSVDAWGIAEDIAPGASVNITIPADAAAGDFEFYCSVPGHREQGMVGTITIAAP